MSSNNNYVLPKIQIMLKNENRLFDCSFYGTLDNAFEALQAFILDSYSLNSNEKFLIQYKDDDNDMVTISSAEDFKEAIDDLNSNGEILKIHVILQQNNNISQKAPIHSKQENNIQNENKTENKTEIENEKEKENENENKTQVANEILNNLRNNKDFREEMISFIKTALILFQQNCSDPDYDIATCILTSLSSHELLMQNETLQQYIMNLLPFIAARIQPFSSFLMAIDANMIGAWISQMIENWAGNSSQLHPPTFSPFYNMISSILQESPVNQFNTEKNKNNKDKDNYQQNDSKQSTSNTQPIISSSIDDIYTQPDSSNENNYLGNQPFGGMGSLLSTLLTPPQGNNVCNDDDVNSNDNLNRDENNCHPLFDHPWARHFHNHEYRHHHHRHHPYSGHPHPFHHPRHPHHHHPHSFHHHPHSHSNDFLPEDDYNNQLFNNEGLTLCVVKEDSTLSDEAVVLPNQILIKTWRIKNIGNKDIGNGLYIKYIGNAFNPMINGAKFPIIINNNKQVLSPNEEVDVSVTIESPSKDGHYSSEWKIFNNDDKPFDLLLTININVCSENINENKNDDDIKINNNNFSIIRQNENDNNINNNNDNTIKTINQNGQKISNQPENNIDPYARQVQSLLEMGFTNVDVLRNLLASHNGLVDDVVNLLA